LRTSLGTQPGFLNPDQ